MKWTDESIVAILKEVNTIYGHIPNVDLYDKIAKESNWPQSHAIKSHTGKTFSYHVRKSGLPRKNNVTEEQVIEGLLLAAKLYGGNIMRRQYVEWQQKNRIYPTVNIITNIFNTFNNAKLAAGLPVASRKINITKEDCINALKKCASETGIQVTEPIYEEWREKQEKPYPTSNTIRRKVGKFRDALELAGEKPIHESHDEKKKQLMLSEYIQHFMKQATFDKWAKENGYSGRDFYGQYGMNFREELEKILLNIAENLQNKQEFKK